MKPLIACLTSILCVLSAAAQAQTGDKLCGLITAADHAAFGSTLPGPTMVVAMEVPYTDTADVISSLFKGTAEDKAFQEAPPELKASTSVMCIHGRDAANSDKGLLRVGYTVSTMPFTAAVINQHMGRFIKTPTGEALLPQNVPKFERAGQAVCHFQPAGGKLIFRMPATTACMVFKGKVIVNVSSEEGQATAATKTAQVKALAEAVAKRW
jgi:hypothetical protein